MSRAVLNNTFSYTVPALFRPPPSDSQKPYAPYISPVTADRISAYTIPAINAMLKELVTLGMMNPYDKAVVVFHRLPNLMCRSRSWIFRFTLWSSLFNSRIGYRRYQEEPHCA